MKKIKETKSRKRAYHSEPQMTGTSNILQQPLNTPILGVQTPNRKWHQVWTLEENIKYHNFGHTNPSDYQLEKRLIETLEFSAQDSKFLWLLPDLSQGLLTLQCKWKKPTGSVGDQSETQGKKEKVSFTYASLNQNCIIPY